MPAELPIEVAAVLTRGIYGSPSRTGRPSPTVWPPLETYKTSTNMRRLATRLFPGTRYRRLLWRYSITQ